MRIVAARITPFRLPLRAPLETASARYAEREGLLLELEDASGARGFGEASPLAAFAGGSLARTHEVLSHLAERAIRRREAMRCASPDALRRTPAACAAMETARLDLVARARGWRLADLLAGGPAAARIAVSAWIPDADAAGAARTARRLVGEGFRTLKLKVGAGDAALDEARVSAVRAAVGPDVALRLDANGAWHEAQAEAALARLARHGIELVEQPTPAHALGALARLTRRGIVPIAADESMVVPRDAREIVARHLADAIVVKPMLLGGPRAAHALAAAAVRAGLVAVVTSSLDSTLGIAAAAHVAAALPEPRAAAGLATAALLADDLATLALEDGALVLPTAPGLGVRPDRDALERVRAGETREIRA